MSIEIWVDYVRRIRYSTARNVVTDREFIDVYGSMVRDPHYDPTFDHLADFTGVERLELTADGLQRIADIMVQRVDLPLASTDARPRVAAVAGADTTFGVLRIYEAFRALQDSPVRYQVFRTMDEARVWLGLPAARSPA
jgi:hypothetical protein